jgi:hypothetical protein
MPIVVRAHVMDFSHPTAELTKPVRLVSWTPESYHTCSHANGT